MSNIGNERDLFLHNIALSKINSIISYKNFVRRHASLTLLIDLKRKRFILRFHHLKGYIAIQGRNLTKRRIKTAKDLLTLGQRNEIGECTLHADTGHS